jgi:molybdopterin-binding protein
MSTHPRRPTGRACAVVANPLLPASACDRGLDSGGSMKISARNVFKGRIKTMTEDVVNVEVVVELPGGAEVVSVITKHSAEALHLAVGKQVYAVIKATDVMIGDPHESH